MLGAPSVHSGDRLSGKVLWWLRVRYALNWRWAIVIAIAFVMLAWLLSPVRSMCTEARAELDDAQRTLILERGRPPEELAEVRARAASAANRLQMYCGQPELPSQR